MLKSSIARIRTFHPDNPVVVVDNSDTPLNASDFEGVRVERASNSACGELNAYLLFLRKPLGFDTAVILHDSMRINRPLTGVERVRSVKLLYHFDEHHHWRNYPEPETPYNQANGIRTHEDLIVDLLSKSSALDPTFKAFALGTYPQKHAWTGCLGVMSIVQHHFLRELDQKTNLSAFIVESIRDKRHRMAMESIFPIACLFLVPLSILEDSYDGLWRHHTEETFTKFVLYRL